MPETIRQIRPFVSAILLALIGATLAACSGGDFGRTRADMRSDDMHRWLGAEVTSSVGLKPSQFQLTDEERQLRDLAYPLIEPPLSRPAWKSVFGDYKALPSPWRQKIVFPRPMYGRTLIDEPHRSHSSRYTQLMEDVRNDITRFEPFFASAIRVIDLDKKRNASMARVVLPLGPGGAGHPGARRHGRRCRPPHRRARRPDRQPAGRGPAALRPRGRLQGLIVSRVDRFRQRGVA